jgi:hypothetical protein
MSRRGVLLVVFVALFVLFCTGWALTAQALAHDAGQSAQSGPPVAAIDDAGISAFNPVPPPPPPKK